MSRYDEKMSQITGPSFKRPEPLSEADLQEVEQKIEFALPADYREFLCNYGNARMIEVSAEYPLSETESGVPMLGLVFWFCGIELIDYAWLSWRRSMNLLSDTTPRELLKIGSGNECELMLALSGEHQGAIYVLYGNGPRSDELELVASSFADLMQRLEPFNPYPEQSFAEYMKRISK